MGPAPGITRVSAFPPNMWNTFNWALSNFVFSLIFASGVFVSLQVQSREQFKGNLLWLQELLWGWSQDGFLLCPELPLLQKYIKNYMKVSS